MRRLFAVLALSALVAACSESPTQTEAAVAVARAPQQLAGGNLNGSLHWKFDTGTMWCSLWDTDEVLVWVNCSIVYTDNGFGWVMKTDGPILNSTGKAAVYNSTHYPAQLVAWYEPLGVGPIKGVMPLCDINVKLYPDADPWGPNMDFTKFACTTNWRYTISASGIGTLTTRWDKQHTYFPFAP